jgi:hypothetical protein
VAHEEPGPREDLLHLQLINVRVVENAAVDDALIDVDVALDVARASEFEGHVDASCASLNLR